MNVENRENFLNKLAAKMGRERKLVPEQMDTPVNGGCGRNQRS